MPDTKLLILIAMVMFTIASMVTTYISLSISVLPEPSVVIPITEDVQWDCAWLALLLAVGIGLMLFALKVAIIDEQKRLNLVGIAGLTVVAFISISFNMDVFYRAANRDFYIRYTSAEMKKITNIGSSGSQFHDRNPAPCSAKKPRPWLVTMSDRFSDADTCPNPVKWCSTRKTLANPSSSAATISVSYTHLTLPTKRIV